MTQYAVPKMTRTLIARLEQLDKGQLRHLADRLLLHDAEAIEECVVFLEMDSRGVWHNRARALMARRLKHCPLTPHQAVRLTDAILQRLITGNFTEQFKDQLRLVLHLDAERAFETARACQSTRKAYVQRYAAWVLNHTHRSE